MTKDKGNVIVGIAKNNSQLAKLDTNYKIEMSLSFIQKVNLLKK